MGQFWVQINTDGLAWDANLQPAFRYAAGVAEHHKARKLITFSMRLYAKALSGLALKNQ